jgi:diguanylate cyclase (GGDEF)-like protein/PAS domain S-box-containing protein
MAVIPLIGSIVLIPIALLTDVGHPAVLAFAAAGLCAVVIRLTRGLAENARLAARVQRDLETLTEAERLVREASEERDAILNAAADGIYRVDGEGRLTFVNTAAASMLGWEADDLLGRDAHEVLHPPGFGGCRGPREECPTAGSAAGHRAHRSDDGLLARRDGTALPVSYVSTPLVTESTGSGAVCVFTDVTERKRTEAERDELLLRVHTLALTDELTELPNRRAWDVALGRELARATRRPVPLCVAMVDLDGLKAINDAHGHQAGSAAIKRAAAAWSGALRDCDLIARFGGDEFAALLPYSTLEQARVVGDRLRSSLGRHPTASIGIAQWEHGESAESVVGRADAALYEAKRRGRDRTVLAPPRSEPDGSGAQRVPGAAAGR